MVIKMRKTNQVFEQKARKCIEILKRIDKQLNQLDKYDPYGDMVQNFEDIVRKRHTLRLIKMLQEDLRWDIRKKTRDQIPKF